MNAEQIEKVLDDFDQLATEPLPQSIQTQIAWRPDMPGEVADSLLQNEAVGTFVVR